MGLLNGITGLKCTKLQGGAGARAQGERSGNPASRPVPGRKSQAKGVRHPGAFMAPTMKKRIRPKKKPERE